MNIFGTIILLVLLCVGIFAISNDFKMAKRIMKYDGKDKQLEKDLKELIDQKTKLYI